MTKLERITALSEQIELARRRLDELPEWQRLNAHFAGSNHGDECGASEEEADEPPMENNDPNFPAA